MASPSHRLARWKAPRHASPAAALREASLTRLRPVLMTSAATVFGHLPLVLVTGPGAEARNSIGTVLVAGMTVGTLFTLFVVPVFYSLIAAKHPSKATHGEPEARPIDAGMDGTDHGERPWTTWARDGEAAGARVQ